MAYNSFHVLLWCWETSHAHSFTYQFSVHSSHETKFVSLFHRNFSSMSNNCYALTTNPIRNQARNGTCTNFPLNCIVMKRLDSLFCII